MTEQIKDLIITQQKLAQQALSEYSGLVDHIIMVQSTDQNYIEHTLDLGRYINFLQAGNKIFMPAFNNKAEDANALARFEEIFGSGNVIPVPSADVAMGGGVLNCLSWEKVGELVSW